MSASVALGVLVTLAIGAVFVLAVHRVFGMSRSTFKGGF